MLKIGIKKIDISSDNKKAEKNLNLFFSYTVLFIVCFTACFGVYFSIFGKSFIWSYDGIDNNYPMFIYVGKWWRRLFKSIFITRSFEIPMFDMSIGYGADIITSLGNGFNNFYNPFYFLSAFCPSAYSEQLFCSLVPVQLYLGGLSFIFMARYKGHGNIPALTGALCYAFCTNTFIIFKQFSFGYIFILFPLLILGYWKMRDGKSPFLYIVSLILCTIYSYYFTYMAAVILVLFFAADMTAALIAHGKSEIRPYLIFLRRLAISSVYACITGACLILPSIIALTKLSRLSVDYDIPLFRDSSYNARLVSGFISAFDGFSDDLMGFPVIALICCVALFTITPLKERIVVKAGFLLMTAALFIPYAGHVLNGFSYSTNRWTWAYSLLVCYIITMIFEKLYETNTKKIVIASSSLIVYYVILKVVFKYDSKVSTVPLIAGLVMAFMFIYIKRAGKKIFEMAGLMAVICSLTIQPFFYFTPRGYNMIKNTVNSGIAFPSVIESGGKKCLLDIIPDEYPCIRYDSLSGRLRNSSMITGFSGYDEYNSIYNVNIDDLNSDLGIRASVSPSVINGLEARSDLEALFGTSYIIRRRDNERDILPYGYSNIVTSTTCFEGSTYDMYVSDSKRSIVLLFDDVISSEEYASSDPYNRQMMMTEGVVLSSDDASPFRSYEDPIPYTVGGSDGVTIGDNTIHVERANGYIDLLFDAPYGGRGEWYAEFINITTQNSDLRSFKFYTYALYEGQPVCGIGSVTPYTSANHMYGGKDTWLLNSSLVDVTTDGMRLVFEDPGDYSYDDIRFYHENEDLIASHVESFVYPDTSVNISGNTFNIEVDCPYDGWLLITLPYLDGWNARLDGSDASIVKADRAFMAVYTPAGQHSLTLSYRTPYLYEGLTCAAILIAGGITYAVIKRKGGRSAAAKRSS